MVATLAFTTLATTIRISIFDDPHDLPNKQTKQPEAHPRLDRPGGRESEYQLGPAEGAIEGTDRVVGEEVAGVEREVAWGGGEDRAGVVGFCLVLWLGASGDRKGGGVKSKITCASVAKVGVCILIPFGKVWRVNVER